MTVTQLAMAALMAAGALRHRSGSLLARRRKVLTPARSEARVQARS